MIKDRELRTATKNTHLRERLLAISLEQLLISVLISSIIILVLFQVYGLIKKQLSKIEQQITILHNRNVADFFLRVNIMQSGYKGFISSVPFSQHSSICISGNNYIIPKAPIAVCKATVANCKNFVTEKLLRRIMDHNIKANTDVLLVYDIPEKVTLLAEDMSDYNSQLKIKLTGDLFEIGDQMIIADLQHIQRFVLSNIIGHKLVHDKPHNTTNNFIKKFKSGAEIFRTKHLAFYIAKNNIDVNSLYIDYFSSNNKHHAEAILDNVENLLVQTVDDGAVMQFVNASDLGWIFNNYILINLLFKNKNIEQNFITGISIRNSGYR